MKYLLIFLFIPFGFKANAQDTIAVENISLAIEVAENGDFVSLALMNDTSRVFPEAFFRIPKEQLIGLVIDNCKYEIIPEAIKSYKNLSYFRYSWFYFSECTLKRFPDFIPETSSLEEIIIEGAKLPNIPSLNKLTALKKLNLSMCELQRFPEQVLELTTLEKLNLSCNQFTTIPDNINVLSNLRSLEFEGGACGGTPISSIPETIGDLKLLEEFTLGYTKTPIKTLPASFYELENLNYFECHGCGLESLSEDLNKLGKLGALKLSNLNYFRAFPEAFFELPNLKRFYFHIYGDAQKELFDQQMRIDEWGQTRDYYHFNIHVKE